MRQQENDPQQKRYPTAQDMLPPSVAAATSSKEYTLTATETSNGAPKQSPPISVPHPEQGTREVIYEWSNTRVFEGVTINIVSAFMIAVGGVLLAALYALAAFIASVLHVPDGLLGLAALLIVGGIFTLGIVVIIIWALVRRTSPFILGGAAIGALVGAAIAATLEHKGERDWAAVFTTPLPSHNHKEPTKTEK